MKYVKYTYMKNDKLKLEVFVTVDMKNKVKLKAGELGVSMGEIIKRSLEKFLER